MREKKLILTLLGITTFPHIFHLPLLLNLYLLLFILYLIFAKNYRVGVVIFAVLGLSFGFVEYVRYINITDLSRAKIFIDIVSSLLIYITSLLILDRFSSPFLRVAPILLLLTSLFYFENLLFLVYAVAVLFTAVVGIIYINSNISLKSAIRYSGSIFIASFPIVVILFFTFPRVSYKNSSFGFKAGDNLITGFGDRISFGSGKKLLQSNQVAMEIMFQDRPPHSSRLYFRERLFYSYKDGGWSFSEKFDLNPRLNLYKFRDGKFIVSSKSFSSPKRLEGDYKISYKATIYPTQTKHIAILDYPLNYPKDLKLTLNYTLLLPKPLFKTKKFQFSSILDTNLSYITPRLRALALSLPPTNPKARELAKKIELSSKSKKEMLKRLEEFFISSKILYTLTPPKLKSKDKIDEFLFKSKSGYCVHFASSFAFMLRVMKIPARVVTGYKADKKSILDRYLIVRAKDAHSWVEAFIDGAWVRVDPTAFALITKESNLGKKPNPFLEKVTLKLMYIKYKIEEWVLYYSRVKQIKLLKMLKESRELLIGILSTLFILVLFSIYFSKMEFSKKQDSISKIYSKVLKKLERDGFFKEAFEGEMSFARRVGDREFENITKIYLQLKYANLNSSQKMSLKREFKRAVKLFNQKSLKKR